MAGTTLHSYHGLRIAHVYNEMNCEIATLMGTKIELDKKIFRFLRDWDTTPGMRIEFDDYRKAANET
jgi:hypothetical protein